MVFCDKMRGLNRTAGRAALGTRDFSPPFEITLPVRNFQNGVVKA